MEVGRVIFKARSSNVAIVRNATQGAACTVVRSVLNNHAFSPYFASLILQIPIEFSLRAGELSSGIRYRPSIIAGDSFTFENSNYPRIAARRVFRILMKGNRNWMLSAPHCYVEPVGFVKIEQSAVVGSRRVIEIPLFMPAGFAGCRSRDLPQAGFHTGGQLNHALALKF